MSQLLNLIIVDDEAFMRENLQSLFPWEELGYTVSAVFSNGSEALENLKKMPADVVLTDISMPVMDGIGLVKNIRKLGIPTEVVFLSAYSDFEYARQGILYGAVDYLVKPVHYQELVDLFMRLRESVILKKNGRENDTPSEKSTPARSASGSDAVISRLSGYIRENAASVTLESCSISTGLDSNFISAYLKEHLSMNFQEFVNREKMIRAAELLHNIRLSINEIADIVGYTNPKNFSRAFHNYYNMTPMQYRKMGKD